MRWIFGGKFSDNFSPGKKAQDLSPIISPRSSLQEEKFVSRKSLWEQPRLKSAQNLCRISATFSRTNSFANDPTRAGQFQVQVCLVTERTIS